MDEIGLLLDIAAFILILLASFYAYRIYRMFGVKDFLWLIGATVYGAFLRSIHLARDFNIPVPPPLFVSRMFFFFYVLLFLGIRAYYKPLKRVWNDITLATEEDRLKRGMDE